MTFLPAFEEHTDLLQTNARMSILKEAIPGLHEIPLLHYQMPPLAGSAQ